MESSVGSKGPGSGVESPALWPWSTKAALAISVVILVVLLAALAAAKASASWPGPGAEAWVMIGIAVLALLPVLLVVLDRLSAQGGEVRVAGVSVSFAQASQVAASGVRTTSLAENLGTSVTGLEATGLRSVLQALRRAHDSEVTVVDLGKGFTWWETRLFILVAGAAYRGAPQAIAFVADLNGRTDAFIGWASPARLLERHMAAVPEFRSAYRDAVRSAAVWDLGEPSPAAPTSVLLPWNKAVFSLPPMTDDVADPTFAMEMFLQQRLDAYPTPAGARAPSTVTVQRLRELYEAVLLTDHIDDAATDEEWARLVARTSSRFLAVTSGEALARLVPRDALIAGLLARMAVPAPGHGATPPR